MQSASVRFGKFQLLEQVSKGNIATVHRAMLHGVGGFCRQITIKRMLPELAARPRFVRAFVDQAKLLALLDHTNIVKIYDFGRVDESYFLAMEYVEGQRLSALERGALSAEEAAHVVQQICAGLHHAHERGLVHGDLNPRNVLRGEDGTVKLVDFGFAQLERAALGDRQSERPWAYLSPEQVAGDPATPWSDIFSAGILLWELLAGRALFEREGDVPATLAAVQVTEVPPLELPDEQDGERFEAICRRALASSPGDRYQNVGAMSDALLEALEGSRTGLRLLYGGELMRRDGWGDPDDPDDLDGIDGSDGSDPFSADAPTPVVDVAEISVEPPMIQEWDDVPTPYLRGRPQIEQSPAPRPMIGRPRPADEDGAERPMIGRPRPVERTPTSRPVHGRPSTGPAAVVCKHGPPTAESGPLAQIRPRSGAEERLRRAVWILSASLALSLVANAVLLVQGTASAPPRPADGPAKVQAVSPAVAASVLAAVGGCRVVPAPARPLRLGLDVAATGSVRKVIVARRGVGIDQAAADCVVRALAGRRLAPLARPRATYFEWLLTSRVPAAARIVRERPSR